MLFKKFQPSKFEDPIDFFEQFMNQAAFRPATKWALQGAVQKTEGFYRKKGGPRVLLAEEKIIFSLVCLLWGVGREQQGFYHGECLLFLKEGSRDGEGSRDRLPH